jgi:hypothetical protein
VVVVPAVGGAGVTKVDRQIDRMVAAARASTDEGLAVLSRGDRFDAAVDRLRARLVGELIPRVGAPEQVVFVIGVARSGTTWLQQLLLTHRDLGGPSAETFLFATMQPLWDVLEASGGPVHADPVVRTALRAFCDELFADALAGDEAQWVVEKTPLHARQVGRIRQLYPDAWYLHIVRDGRDVVRSLSMVDFLTDVEVTSAARLWRDTLDSVRREGAGLRHLIEVHYEDLVAEPEVAVADLITRMGLTVGPDDRERFRRTVGVRVSRHGTTGPVGSGKWRDLPPRALAEIYGVAGRALVAEGYITPGELRRWYLHPRYIRARLAEKLRAGTQPSGAD